MSAPLWTFEALTKAIGAEASYQKTGGLECVPASGVRGDSPALLAVTGISIDTRTIQPGDLFVALTDARDGHEFVTAAFKKGAAAALVGTHYEPQPGDGPLFRVADPLAALENLGRAARARLSDKARVIAVTGSAGKTTTKEMLKACLTPLGKTHASEKSYNNHWGVPLTLARMRSDTEFAVFEIGMNHAGEITPLSKMVRPHVAIITTVGAVHLEHFASVADIARAKAEIFLGLETGGTAILPGNNPNYPLLAQLARDSNVEVVSFGLPLDLAGKTNHVNSLDLTSCEFEEDPWVPQTVWVNSRPGQLYDDQVLLRFSLGLRGDHMALNAAAVVLALDRIGVLSSDLELAPLATLSAGAGRGQAHAIGGIVLIDETYNANPASMRAALATMVCGSRATSPRRIAVLGDMLELGAESPRLHAELADAIEANHVDLVVACGPLMRHLYDRLPEAKRGGWAYSSGELTEILCERVTAGDVVMIKGSNGSRMGVLVAALIARHGSEKHATG